MEISLFCRWNIHKTVNYFSEELKEYLNYSFRFLCCLFARLILSRSFMIRFDSLLSPPAPALALVPYIMKRLGRDATEETYIYYLRYEKVISTPMGKVKKKQKRGKGKMLKFQNENYCYQKSIFMEYKCSFRRVVCCSRRIGREWVERLSLSVFMHNEMIRYSPYREFSCVGIGGEEDMVQKRWWKCRLFCSTKG